MNNRYRTWITILVVLVVASVAVNIWFASRGNHKPNSEVASTEEVYTCPMHPQVVQDHPGDCPICGMKLVKRQRGTATDQATDSLAGTVTLSPSQEVLANVRTEHPRYETLQTSRTYPGRIVAREENEWAATVRAMGRVEKLYVSTPGEKVKAGDPLYDYYSPDLASAQREFLLAKSSGEATVSAAKAKLLSLGMESRQIEALEANGSVRETLTFTAPANGTLLAKMASVGDWTMQGMKLLDFNDLSTVWVEGNLNETDGVNARLGDKVMVTSDADPSRSARASITWITAEVDLMTRSLAFRAELSNGNGFWRPEMFVRVALEGASSGKTLTVSEDAVLVTGHAKRVWVRVAEGRYRPMDVKTGMTTNGRTAILSGLKPEDEVVSSGGYLVDSDAEIKSMAGGSMPGMDMGDGSEAMDASNQKGSMEGMEMPSDGGGKEKSTAQPSGAMKMESSSEQNHSAHDHKAASTETASAKTVYTCPMHPDVVSDKPGKCPKCGMYLMAKAAPGETVRYTCPMHPDVVRDKPGKCPECGMYLVKKEG